MIVSFFNQIFYSPKIAVIFCCFGSQLRGRNHMISDFFTFSAMLDVWQDNFVQGNKSQNPPKGWVSTNVCCHVKSLSQLSIMYSILDNFIKGDNDPNWRASSTNTRTDSHKQPLHSSIPVPNKRFKATIGWKHKTLEYSQQMSENWYDVIHSLYFTLSLTYLQISTKVCLVVIFNALVGSFCKRTNRLSVSFLFFSMVLCGMG